MANDFYKWFSERRLTKFGGAQAAAHRAEPAGSAGPARCRGRRRAGSRAGCRQPRRPHARQRGWRYRAIEASPTLAASLRERGVEVTEAWVPPFPVPDACCDVLYADQVLEHMSGIDGARAFASEAFRVLRPGGVVFIVVPDYLKERTFFWDVDYTHNFVTTERRVRQLLGDHGFAVERVVRSIGASTGVARDLLAGASMLANLPGLEPLSRYTRHRRPAVPRPQELLRDADLRGSQAGVVIARLLRSTAVRVLVTAAILVYLFRDDRSGGRQVGAMLRVDPWWFAVTLALVAARPRGDGPAVADCCSGRPGVDLPARSAVRIFLSSSFVGSFLPAGVGGDALARRMRWRRGPRREAEAVASVAIDRILGVVAVRGVSARSALAGWARHLIRRSATDLLVVSAAAGVGALALRCGWTARARLAARTRGASAGGAGASYVSATPSAPTGSGPRRCSAVFCCCRSLVQVTPRPAGVQARTRSGVDVAARVLPRVHAASAC